MAAKRLVFSVRAAAIQPTNQTNTTTTSCVVVLCCFIILYFFILFLFSLIFSATFVSTILKYRFFRFFHTLKNYMTHDIDCLVFFSFCLANVWNRITYTRGILITFIIYEIFFYFCYNVSLRLLEAIERVYVRKG